MVKLLTSSDTSTKGVVRVLAAMDTGFGSIEIPEAAYVEFVQDIQNPYAACIVPRLWALGYRKVEKSLLPEPSQRGD